ncbi:MAG: AI-2E family transporter [Clostridiales bacterium]|jgi:predicted PurR-regulated permease PerM|nr:AI-2E family transporter [Clostridiales bacterium]
MEHKPTGKGGGIKKYVPLIICSVALFILIYRTEAVWAAIKWVFAIIAPLLLGVVLAYIVHMPMNFFQQTLFGRAGRNPKKTAAGRAVSLCLAYACIFAVIVLFVYLLIPPIGNSIASLASNFASYLSRFQSWADGFLSSLSLNIIISDTVGGFWRELTAYMQSLLGKALNGAFAFTVGFTSGAADFLFAIIISAFILLTKEKLFSQFERLSAALFGWRFTARVSAIAALVNDTFSGFIIGRALDAVILGLLCFICMTAFGMQYALLISAVIAITALIPIVGAWVGTVLSALILLLIDPMQALWFVILIVILQQIENLIYSRIVGNAIGLPGLWVLSSILVGGGVAGVWGMILATPMAAVCYRLTGQWLKRRETENKKAGGMIGPGL